MLEMNQDEVQQMFDLIPFMLNVSHNNYYNMYFGLIF